MSGDRSVFLVGFSGCGKSTVGRELARALKARFYDTDMIVARSAGKNISRIFAENGERYFRDLEEKITADIAARDGRKVVALGGGALLSRTNRKVVFAAGTVVYLTCSQKVLYARLKQMSDRPLLKSTAVGEKLSGEHLRRRIAELLKQRLPNYRKCHLTLSTSRRSVSETVRELKKKLG